MAGMNDTHPIENPSIPTPIRGWLIIPAIGLALSPIGLVLSDLWAFMQIRELNPKLMVTHEFAVMVFLDVATFIFTIVVAVLFFRRKESTKHWFPALLLFNLLAAVFSGNAGATMLKIGVDTSGMIRALVYAAIWIPYFMASKRVTRTFVIADHPPLPSN